MSVGSNLQEMENVVTKGAAAADPMPSAGTNASGVMAPGQTGSWEDLGGPTPENYRPDDDSATLKTPGATLSQVRDVVNAKASPADPAPSMKEEEEVEGEVVAEEDTADEEEITNEIEEEAVEEEVETESVIEYDVEEDINALIAGEELSEEFEERARTIFETAINTKVAEIKEELVTSYEASLVEEVASIKTELTDRVDAYLEYVADEWISENSIAVEHGLKTEMMESFLSGMKTLFEEHYVTVPEDRYDVIESMVDKLDEMEGKLNEQIERNIALNRRLAESVADVIFADVAEGLAISQKDKLASLAENVEFDSEESYREKLVTLRESYFPVNTGAQREDSENLSEEVNLTEETEMISEGTTNAMDAYLQVLRRSAKK
jgi:hypothetical protein